jgi:ABC-type polysaccharide/polyol phosphate export permease
VTEIVLPQGLPRLGLSESRQTVELIYPLALRDLKKRDRQTIVGVSWAWMQPLMTMVVFHTPFSRVARSRRIVLADPSLVVRLATDRDSERGRVNEFSC